MTNRLEIYVWGFPPDDLQTWPDDLEPHAVDLDTWPGDGPVVVHGRAWSTFQKLCNEGRIETGSDIVLYLPPGMGEPDDAWAYVDEVSHAGNGAWEVLRNLAVFPSQYQVEAWAGAVPNDVLDTLHHTDHRLDYHALPLPPSVLTLLRDQGYQKVFDEAVRRRLRARRLTRGFSEETLEDYVRNRMDDPTRKEVEAFLASAPLAHDSVADLASLLQTLREGKTVLIEGDDYTCTVTYDAARRTIIFSDLFGAGRRPKKVFWIEFWAGEETIRLVRSLEGRITVRLETMQQVLEKGADRFVISAA